MKSENSSIDYPLFLAIFALVIFGLVMISSVSVFESHNLTKELADKFPEQYGGPSNDFYLIRSLQHVALALPLWFIIMKIPYLFWKKAAPFLFFMGIVLLLLLFTSLGVTYKGATGWLNISFLPSIQPVELVKIGVILYFARWLEHRKQELQTLENGFIPFLTILGSVILLLALQPDFGAIMIITPIAVAMYYVAGANIKHLVGGFLVALVFFSLVIATVPHVNKRFNFFVNPDVDPEKRNIGWQIEQSLIAIGSGGWFGRGFGKSVQKFGYLPEVQGDTIFAAISEELGFVRISILLGLYILIAYRGYRIAYYAPDRFSSLVATGITTWFVWQTVLNIFVNIKLFPFTGITLPFVSYGGSSLSALMIGAGILLHISRYAKTKTVVRRRGIWGPYFS